jgi:hypothetical protein
MVYLGVLEEEQVEMLLLPVEQLPPVKVFKEVTEVLILWDLVVVVVQVNPEL